MEDLINKRLSKVIIIIFICVLLNCVLFTYYETTPKVRVLLPTLSSLKGVPNNIH